jgi:hypothetical protein
MMIFSKFSIVFHIHFFASSCVRGQLLALALFDQRITVSARLLKELGRHRGAHAKLETALCRSVVLPFANRRLPFAFSATHMDRLKELPVHCIPPVY